jgi:hypothetical protein
MIKRLPRVMLLAALVVLMGTSVALSFSCPIDIASFDKAVAAGPKVAAEVLAKSIKLRNKAERQHQAGDHGGSIESINMALDLIGAE